MPMALTMRDEDDDKRLIPTPLIKTKGGRGEGYSLSKLPLAQYCFSSPSAIHYNTNDMQCDVSRRSCILPRDLARVPAMC